VDPQLPSSSSAPWTRSVAGSLSGERFQTTLLATHTLWPALALAPLGCGDTCCGDTVAERGR